MEHLGTPRWLTALLIGGLALAALGGCTSAGKSAAKDVSVTSCTAGAGSAHPVARGQIDNGTSKASTYVIHVKFNDPSGNHIGDGVATVAKVAAHGTATWHATGSRSAHGALTCPIASVTRTVVP